MESFDEKIRRKISNSWVSHTYRFGGSVALCLEGAYIGKNGFNIIAIIGIIIMIAVFGFFEYYFSQIRRDLIRDVSNLTSKNSELFEMMEDIKKHNKQNISDLEFKRELNKSSSGFLRERFQKASIVISIIQSALDGTDFLLKEMHIQKEATIEDTLKEMCNALIKSYDAKIRNIYNDEDTLNHDVMFRATYMEIVNIGGNEVLKYLAYWNPAGNIPVSMSKNIMYKKGEGCAGIAWERRRPVIEDKFKHDKEWIDNYSGQGSLYQSMVCVPVSTKSHSSKESFFGVITVDTNIVGFFGEKGNSLHEQDAGVIIRPFSEYIAFTYLAAMLAKNLKALVF